MRPRSSSRGGLRPSVSARSRRAGLSRSFHCFVLFTHLILQKSSAVLDGWLYITTPGHSIIWTGQDVRAWSERYLLRARNTTVVYIAASCVLVFLGIGIWDTGVGRICHTNFTKLSITHTYGYHWRELQDPCTFIRRSVMRIISRVKGEVRGGMAFYSTGYLLGLQLHCQDSDRETLAEEWKHNSTIPIHISLNRRRFLDSWRIGRRRRQHSGAGRLS